MAGLGICPVTPQNQIGPNSTSLWNPINPRTPSQIARLRYRQNEHFKLWRRGLRNEEESRGNIPLANLPGRRSGRWGGLLSLESTAVQIRRDFETTRIRYYPSGGSSPPKSVGQPTRKVMKRLTGATLVKILGFGGFGVATLLDVRSKQGSVRRVVMKTVIGDDGWATDNLKTEKEWQISLMRSMHVVELIKWSTLRGLPRCAGGCPDRRQPVFLLHGADEAR
jgi:hypothetical protein